MIHNQMDPPQCKDKPNRSPCQRKQYAFRQQLTNDAASARPHGGAHRKLLASPRYPRKLYVGHICTSDQQNEPNRAQEQECVLACEVACSEFLEGPRKQPKAFARVGILLGLPLSNRFHFGGALCEWDTRFEPSKDK